MPLCHYSERSPDPGPCPWGDKVLLSQVPCPSRIVPSVQVACDSVPGAPGWGAELSVALAGKEAGGSAGWMRWAVEREVTSGELCSLGCWGQKWVPALQGEWSTFPSSPQSRASPQTSSHKLTAWKAHKCQLPTAQKPSSTGMEGFCSNGCGA